MKFVILLALLGLALAVPILSGGQEDVRILSDGSIVVSNGLGKRIFIQKALESKGDVEVILKNNTGFNRVIEISSPTEIVRDVIRDSADVETTVYIKPKPVDGKKSKSKAPIVNGDAQLKTLQAIVREFQGILDTTSYVELLNKISAAVNSGQLNPVILDAFRAISQDQQQATATGNNNTDTQNEAETTQESQPAVQEQKPADLWSQLQNYLPQAQNPTPAQPALVAGQNQAVVPAQNPWAAQYQPGVWNQSWGTPTSTFGAQNSYIKFGPGGPFGPFGPYAPLIWNTTALPNPWVAYNPYIQANPWVTGNPWLVPQAAAAASGADGQQGAVDGATSTFGAQNSFALKFPGGVAPWWLSTSPIDGQIKDATKYQKTALKNLQQLQELKLAQSTAAAAGGADSSVPQIDYDSAIQSAYDVLNYAQKNLADLAYQKQQQQLAMMQQLTQPPFAPQQPAPTQQPAAGQQPDIGPQPVARQPTPTSQVPYNQAFFVNQESAPTAQPTDEPAAPLQTASDQIVPNPFTSFKVKGPFGKPTKPPKEAKPVSDAPEIAQTKVAAAIQGRIQAIQDQWNQQNLLNQQLLQQQSTVTQQIKTLQDQLQLAKAQGASPELLNQIQLAQQDLAGRQGSLVQQQLNQQAVANSLQAQLALLSEQLKSVPNANIPEGATTWPEVLGISKSPKGKGVARVPLNGGLQGFTTAF